MRRKAYSNDRIYRIIGPYVCERIGDGNFRCVDRAAARAAARAIAQQREGNGE